ncbi:MAG: hypothetical protein Q9163_004032 [Psora crenata]
MAKTQEGSKKNSKDKEDDVTKRKKGFSVGPSNLPDGSYKRKVQKIKKNLIRKAKLKKSYAKLKLHGNLQSVVTVPTDAQTPDSSLKLHPERQALLDEGKAIPDPIEEPSAQSQQRRAPRPKTIPYRKEFLQAQQRKEQQEQRRRELEESNRQKQVKRQEHERVRKQLDKARRPGRDGQRRLGRESKFLPGMVENLFRKLNEQNASSRPLDTR